MKKVMPPITIGMPVFNERLNLEQALKSILRQKANSFYIKEILIVDDASSDNSVAIARSFAKKNKTIKIITNTKQRGKATRVNDIVENASSKFLFLLDADVVLAEDSVFESMLDVMMNKSVSVVVPLQLPTKSKGFIASVLYHNYIVWQEMRLKHNDGNNIFNLLGSCSLQSMDFAKSFRYPTNISNDMEFLFIKSQSQKGFAIAKNAIVYYNPVRSLSDLIILGKRTQKERFNLVKHFGERILTLYEIPLKIKFTVLISNFFKYPIKTISIVILNIFVKLLYFGKKPIESGLWTALETTKSKIVIGAK